MTFQHDDLSLPVPPNKGDREMNDATTEIGDEFLEVKENKRFDSILVNWFRISALSVEKKERFAESIKVAPNSDLSSIEIMSSAEMDVPLNINETNQHHMDFIV